MSSRIQPGSIGLRLLRHSRRTINYYAPTVRRSPEPSLPTAWQESVSEPLIWQMPTESESPALPDSPAADAYAAPSPPVQPAMPPRRRAPAAPVVRRSPQQAPEPPAPPRDNRRDDDEEKVSPMLNRILQLHRQRELEDEDGVPEPDVPEPPSDPVQVESPPLPRHDGVSPANSQTNPVQRQPAVRRGRRRSRLASEQTPLQRKQQREQGRSQPPASPEPGTPSMPRTLSEMMQSDVFDDVGDFEADEGLTAPSDFADYVEDTYNADEAMLPDLDPPPPTPARPLQRRTLIDSSESSPPQRSRTRLGRRQPPAPPANQQTVSRSENAESLPSLPGIDEGYQDDMDTIPLQPARDITFPSQSEVKAFTPDDMLPQDMPFDEQVDTTPFVPIRSENSKPVRKPDTPGVQRQSESVTPAAQDLPLLDGDSQEYINTEPMLNDTPPPPIRRNHREKPLKSLFDVGRSALDPPAPPEPDTPSQQIQPPQATRQDVVQAAFADQLDDSDDAEDESLPVRRTFADDHDPDLSFTAPVQRRPRDRPPRRPPVPPPPVQRQDDSAADASSSDVPVIEEDDDTEKVTTVQDRTDMLATPPDSRALEGSIAADLLRALNLPPDSPVAGLADNTHLNQPVQRAADTPQESSTGQDRQRVQPPVPSQPDPPRQQAIPLDQALLQNGNVTANNTPPAVQRAEAPPPASNATAASVSIPEQNQSDEADSGESQGDDDWNLDKLARDVYRQLRNRLRIEQERRSDRNG